MLTSNVHVSHSSRTAIYSACHYISNCQVDRGLKYMRKGKGNLLLCLILKQLIAHLCLWIMGLKFS